MTRSIVLSSNIDKQVLNDFYENNFILVKVSQYEKREKLLEVVRGLIAGGGTGGLPAKILVFVEMKKTADFLASYMCQSGLPTTSIHGDRSVIGHLPE